MKTKNLFFISCLFVLSFLTKSSAQLNNLINTTSTPGGGSNNTFVGVNSGPSNTAQQNAGFGYNSLSSNTTGGFNAAFGAGALGLNVDGGYNCAFGQTSLYSNVSGINNVALGFRAMNLNTNAKDNIAIGYGAGLNTAAANYDENIAIGVNTPRNFDIGGKRNIFIGHITAKFLRSGNYNTIIGGGVELNNAASTATDAGNDTSNTVIIADGLANQRIFVHKDGYTGIGLGNNKIPKNRLELDGGVAGTSGLRFRNYNSGSTPVASNGRVLTLNAAGDVVLTTDVGSGGSTVIADGTNTTVTGTGVTGTPYQIHAKNIYTDDGVLSGNRMVDMDDKKMIFDTQTDGRIYIGNTSGGSPFTVGAGNNFPLVALPESNYRLLVEGGILTEKVKIALRSTADWADYVFADNYQLMPLKEVETFVKENKHLPGIDSAKELTKNGLDVANMQAKQMEKIEELTLYVIEQNKALEKQSKEIEELKAQVKLLLNK